MRPPSLDSLLLPPPLPWPRLPAVTRDSPPASRAAARGGGEPPPARLSSPRSPEQRRPLAGEEGDARPRLPAASFPACSRAPAARPLPRRGHVPARGAWRPRPLPGRLPRAPRPAAPAGRALAGARRAPPPRARARPLPASPARPSSRAPPAPYIQRPAQGAQSAAAADAAAAAAPRPRCRQRPPPRQLRGRASPGSKPAFSPRVRACAPPARRPRGPGERPPSSPAAARAARPASAGTCGLGLRPPGRGGGRGVPRVRASATPVAGVGKGSDWGGSGVGAGERACREGGLPVPSPRNGGEWGGGRGRGPWFSSRDWRAVGAG